MIVARRTLTDALRSYLEVATGKKIGDHEAPLDVTLPYGVLYLLDGGSWAGPDLAAPQAIAWFPFQVTSVGAERNACQWLADRVQAVLVSRGPTGALPVDLRTAIGTAGLTLLDVEMTTAGGADREGHMWQAPDRYTIAVTPS